MGVLDTALHRVYTQLKVGNAGMAIVEMGTYLAAWPDPRLSDKLETLKSDYDLLNDYWVRGVADPERDDQYLKLLQRVYVLMANIAIQKHKNASLFLQMQYQKVHEGTEPINLEIVRAEMQNFVSEVAMLELEADYHQEEQGKTIYRDHYQQMNKLFSYLLTSEMWTDNMGQQIEEILTSPTIDANDQQLLVSAVMLSQMNRFDIVKFRTLIGVYCHSANENVRQQALIAWVLGIDDTMLRIYPEQRALVTDLLKSKRVCTELTELQVQMIYTLNSETDQETIQKEIYPDLMNSQMFRVTMNGVEEKEDDALEDVLHPDAAEERMEKLENTIQRLFDMQRKGIDVYYSGFSQTKRIPFFYEIANWFIPFFIQHPDVSNVIKSLGDYQFVELLFSNDILCNSDKYSFLLSFQQVLHQIPKEMREVLKYGGGMPNKFAMDSSENRNPAVIRSICLMDMYRFYNLFPNRRSFINPFDRHDDLPVCYFFFSDVFRNTPIDTYRPQVVRVLLKYHMHDDAQSLLDRFPESMHNVQYYLWRSDYENALRLDPDNERALSLRAHYNFSHGMFQRAFDDYDHLLLLHPDKVKYMLYKSICLLNMEEYDDALKLLYRLNYEDDTDITVQSVLAWALVCSGKLEQAKKIYIQLTSSKNACKEDYLNQAYCLWLMGDIKAAAESFEKFFEQDGELDEAFGNKAWLQKRGISETDIQLMQMYVMKYEAARKAVEKVYEK